MRVLTFRRKELLPRRKIAAPPFPAAVVSQIAELAIAPAFRRGPYFPTRPT